jgi:hypothetical protein
MVAVGAHGGGGAGLAERLGGRGGLGSFPLAPPHSVGGQNWLDPCGGVGSVAGATRQRQDAGSGDGGSCGRAWWRQCRGGGGLGSFLLPPPRSVGVRIPSRWPARRREVSRGGTTDGGDGGVAWEAKWP